MFISLVALCSGCSQLTIWNAVRGFSKHAGKMIAKEYEPKGDFQKKLSTELETLVGQRNHDHELLQAVYGTTGYQFRFVKDHKPTADHKALAERIDAIYQEGIDPIPYEIEKRDQYVQALYDAEEKFNNLKLDNIVIDQSELNALSDALKKADIADLSLAGILNFILDPAQNGKFPALQKTAADAAQAALARSHAEANLELLDAVNFFHLAAEMGVAEDKMIETWNESVTDMAGTLKKMIPINQHYPALVKELAHYRQLAKLPEPYQFPLTLKVKPGTKGEVVKQIQERLKIEGFWNGPIDGNYDEALKTAVIDFQVTHQVGSDGIVERGTLMSFNVPFSHRVKQIKLALHKMRHSVIRGGDYFVWVNIGTQEVEVYSQGGTKLLRKHRIIVGNRATKNHTPLFSDEIEKIVFNPPWMVPERIILEEMLPAYLENPDYFKNNGYVAKIIESDTGNDAGDAAPATEGQPAKKKKVKIAAVTQPPGYGNALGVVKILFPNKHAVYLHDTPTKPLFKRAVRSYSHGCMRLQNAVDMARFLLEQDGNEFVNEVDEVLKTRQTKTVHLKKPVPIHIEYITVTTDENGKAFFCEDIYNLEKEDLEAMNAD